MSTDVPPPGWPSPDAPPEPVALALPSPGPAPTPPSVRPAQPGEVAAIAAAASAVFRPAGGDMAHDYPLLFAAGNAANLFVVRDAGDALLAHAGFTLRPVRAGDERFPAACLGAVFTRPDAVGRGLASAVVDAAVAAALAAGARLVLVSGARGLYRRSGCMPYPTPWFEIAVPGSPVAGLTLSVAGSADADVLATLAAGERVAFLRSRADWVALLGSGTVFYGPGHTHLARLGDSAAAYLVVQTLASGRRRVVEYAGQRPVVLAAARLLAAAGPLSLLVPPHDIDLLLVAHDEELSPDLVSLPFSVRPAAPVWAARIPAYGLDYV